MKVKIRRLDNRDIIKDDDFAVRYHPSRDRNRFEILPVMDYYQDRIGIPFASLDKAEYWRVECDIPLESKPLKSPTYEEGYS